MVKPTFADRMSHVVGPASHAVMSRVREMRAQGIDVIDLGRQRETPEIARKAATAAMNSPSGSFYTDTRGATGLREAIAAKLLAENGIPAAPATDIVVTVGAKEAILAVMMAFVDTGDEVLIEDPAYVGFEPLVRFAGGMPKRVPLTKADEFRLPVENLRSFITPRTRLLLLCNPHNPSGHCYTAADLAAIGAIAAEYGINVVVDEAYEHFIYDGRRHVSLASLPGMYERTITVQTVSKIYNMAGWRVGWAVAPPALMDKIHIAHANMVTCPTSFAQAGAEAVIRSGIGEGDQPIADIVERYAAQRNALVAGLQAIPGVTCTMPQGAFFAFPDLSGFGRTSAKMCDVLLEKAHFAAIPGSAFGEMGEGHVRMVFKSDVETINKGVARLADALADLDRAELRRRGSQ